MVSCKTLFVLAVMLTQSSQTSFIQPCFEEDREREMEFCSDPSGDCFFGGKGNHDRSIKLVRIEGYKKGHIQEVDLGEERNYTLITKAMKPLMFELPNFLSDKECDHIVDLANDAGLKTSIAGFKQSIYDGDLEKELANVTSQVPPQQFQHVMNFILWDKNNDGIIDSEEIRYFVERNKLLFLKKDEILRMFEKLGFHDHVNETITEHAFQKLNKAKLLVYLDYMKNKHPKYRARYSEQAWLHQNTKSDSTLRHLHERIIKLTKLPRKVVQGGEALQVVRYGPEGHYHVHYDSMPFPDDVTENLPCCHHKVQQPNGCRLCRLLTILYYLNDVEKGGETAFLVADNTTFKHEELSKTDASKPKDDFNLSLNCHKANLVVSPKKGQAIMWYNHFIDEDTGLLGDVDEYSLHGGCDVIEGEKWIANNWITAPPPGRQHIPSVYDIGFD